MTKPWKRPHRLPDADAVLSGRVTIDASTLVALIHAVNPTGHDLSQRERSRRYALKSALQSLLVLRHKKELSVRADPDHPELAVLELTRIGGDACHAVISELDPDARSWVQLNVDIERSSAADPAEPEAAPQPLHPRNARDEAAEPSLHEIGLRALRQYDYETAKDALIRAAALAPGDERVATDALTLLVDHLAADAEARELWTGLEPAVREAPEVRLLAALAFARSGMRAEISALLGESIDARVGDVLAAAALGAVADGEPDEAEQWRRQLVELDPTHERLDALDESIRASRARAVKADELRLEERVCAGAPAEELERMARAVLDRFPESSVARAALRTIRAQQREAQSAALLSRLHNALEAADLVAALEVVLDPEWSRVPGADRSPLERRVAALRRRHAEEQRQAAAQHVAGLVANDVQCGLAAYLELEPDARALVRRAIPQHGSAFATLDEIGDRAASSDSAAAAASALEQALALASSDPTSAYARIEPHERLLGRLSGYRSIKKRALEHARRQRHERASAALQEAAELERSGDLERALELLGAIESTALDPNEQAELGSILPRVERAAKEYRLRNQVATLLAEDRLIDARRALEAALSETAEDAHHELLAEIERLDARLRRQFAVSVYDGPLSPAVAADFSWPLVSDRASAWARDGEIVLTDSTERWVFSFVVEIATASIRRVVRLRTPEPMDLAEVVLEADRIWAIGARGHVLAFGARDGRVEHWFSPGALVAPDDVVDDVALASARWLWLGIRGENRPTVIVYDLHKHRVARTLSALEQIDLAPVDAEPRIVAWGEGANTRTFRSNGGGARILYPEMLNGVTVHPDRAKTSWIALRTGYRDGEYEELRLLDLGSEREIVVADANPTRAHSIAVARDEQLAFVRFCDDDDRWQLATFGLVSGHFVELGRQPAAFECHLVSTPDHAAAWAVTLASDGPAVTGLSRTITELPKARPRLSRLDVPDTRPFWYCMEGSSEESEIAVALRALPSAESRRLLAEQLVAEHHDDPNALWQVVRAIRNTLPTSREWAAELERDFHQRFADSAVSRLARANEIAKQGEWQLAHLISSPIDPSDLDPAHRQHFHHLRAAAELRHGELDAARRSLALAAAHGTSGQCELQALSEMLDALQAPADAQLPSDAHPAHRLVRAILAADRELASENPRAALDRIRDAGLSHGSELQLLGRAASAWLAIEAGSDAERIEQIRTIARFVHWQHDALRLEALMPRAWDEQTLSRLSDRARAWLDAQ